MTRTWRCLYQCLHHSISKCMLSFDEIEVLFLCMPCIASLIQCLSANFGTAGPSNCCVASQGGDEATDDDIQDDVLSESEGDEEWYHAAVDAAEYDALGHDPSAGVGLNNLLLFFVLHLYHGSAFCGLKVRLIFGNSGTIFG